MFRKILIANRGEIAVRIIRAARELGIATVAVYSTADKEALHTLLADEAVCIGPAKSTDSYLNMNAVLSAAVLTEAEAIHPGFGFLSENSKFATMCEEVGIKFIGPSGAVMDLMGDKINARAQMIKAKVPVIPGSDGEVYTSKEALEVAEKIGYPVMLKASAGGGGKGIRKVEKAEDLVAAFESASSEAKAAFGNGAMYMERVIYPARHIEVQILADQQGHVVHLGERDCSLQRNNQKVLEESPSVAIGKTLRQQIGEAAVRAAQSVGYENAGTIEFLLDEAKGEFYFMEMNTRVQVEHPVTEFVTGSRSKSRLLMGRNCPLDRMILKSGAMQLSVGSMLKIQPLTLRRVLVKFLTFIYLAEEWGCAWIQLSIPATLSHRTMTA